MFAKVDIFRGPLKRPYFWYFFVWSKTDTVLLKVTFCTFRTFKLRGKPNNARDSFRTF